MNNIGLSFWRLKARETAFECAQSAVALQSRNGNSLNPNRASRGPSTITPTTAMSRAYLRAMRAAEMVAWELTGGDYLRSCLVTRT